MAIADARLSDADVRVLAAVLTWARSGSDCWASTETIAERAAKKIKAVQLALRNLRHHGYIRMVPDSGKPSGRRIVVVVRAGESGAAPRGCEGPSPRELETRRVRNYALRVATPGAVITAPAPAVITAAGGGRIYAPIRETPGDEENTAREPAGGLAAFTPDPDPDTLGLTPAPASDPAPVPPRPSPAAVTPPSGLIPDPDRAALLEWAATLGTCRDGRTNYRNWSEGWLSDPRIPTWWIWTVLDRKISHLKADERPGRVFLDAIVNQWVAEGVPDLKESPRPWVPLVPVAAARLATPGGSAPLPPAGGRRGPLDEARLTAEDAASSEAEALAEAAWGELSDAEREDLRGEVRRTYPSRARWGPIIEAEARLLAVARAGRAGGSVPAPLAFAVA